MAKIPGARSLAHLVAFGGLIVILTPIWLIDCGLSRLRTMVRAGGTREIERMSLNNTDLPSVLRRGVPVILTDLYERLELTVRPDLHGLRSIGDGHPFPVTRHSAERPFFLYVGDYGATRVRTDHLTITEFFDDLWIDTEEQSTYKLFARDGLGGGIGSIIEEMADQLEQLAGRAADVHASGIWIGSKRVTTPLHHDAWTGLLFQPVGSKQVVMFGPEDRGNIYFSSPFRPTSRWSRLPARSREADRSQFPRLARAVRFEARLGEGETLFIPPYWSHEVEALEPNVSIPFRFAARPIDHLNPGFLRPAVEVFHRKLMALRR